MLLLLVDCFSLLLLMVSLFSLVLVLVVVAGVAAGSLLLLDGCLLVDGCAAVGIAWLCLLVCCSIAVCLEGTSMA